MHPSRSHSKAFTLTEILICMAIIGILVATLSPALQTVHLNGKIAKTISNLRTLQTANIAYANDHNWRYLPVAGWNEKGHGILWYEDANFRANYLDIPESGPWPDEMLSPLATLRDANGNRLIQRTYGYNFTGLGGVFGTPGLTRQAAVTHISSPSRVLAFADALDWQIQMSGADRYAGKEEKVQNGIAYRYKNRAGIVFFDGHGEMVDRESVVNNKALWNIDAQ